MEIELHPAVSLLPETFNVLVAPVEMMVDALNSHLELQCYKILFISGNYSRILSRLDRNFTELEVRRAFTSFQLMTIPKGEPPQLPDRGARPVALRGCRRDGRVPGPSALRQTSREATILLYAPALDPHLQKITDLANLGVLHLQRAGSGQSQEGRGEDTGSAENAGGILMRWPWKRQAKPIEPRRAGWSAY